MDLNSRMKFNEYLLSSQEAEVLQKKHEVHDQFGQIPTEQFSRRLLQHCVADFPTWQATGSIRPSTAYANGQAPRPSVNKVEHHANPSVVEDRIPFSDEDNNLKIQPLMYEEELSLFSDEDDNLEATKRAKEVERSRSRSPQTSRGKRKYRRRNTSTSSREDRHYGAQNEKSRAQNRLKAMKEKIDLLEQQLKERDTQLASLQEELELDSSDRNKRLDIWREDYKWRNDSDLKRDRCQHEINVKQPDQQTMLEKELSELQRRFLRYECGAQEGGQHAQDTFRVGNTQPQLQSDQMQDFLETQKASMLQAVQNEYDQLFVHNSGPNAASRCCSKSYESAKSKGSDTPSITKCIRDVLTAVDDGSILISRLAHEYDYKFRERIASLERSACRKENVQAMKVLVSSCQADLQKIFAEETASLKFPRHRIASAVQAYLKELKMVADDLANTAEYAKVFEALRITAEKTSDGFFVLETSPERFPDQ